MLFPHVNFLSFAIGSPLDFCSRRVITVLLEYTNLVLLRYVAYACSDQATSPVFVSSSTSWECGSGAVCPWRWGVCVWSSKCYLTAGILVRFADYRSCLLRWCRSVNRVNLWGIVPLVATVAVVAIVQNHSGPEGQGVGDWTDLCWLLTGLLALVPDLCPGTRLSLHPPGCVRVLGASDFLYPGVQAKESRSREGCPPSLFLKNFWKNALPSTYNKRYVGNGLLECIILCIYLNCLRLLFWLNYMFPRKSNSFRLS